MDHFGILEGRGESCVRYNTVSRRAAALTPPSARAAAPPLKPIRCGQDVSPEVQDAAFHAPEFAHVHHRGKALAARRRALRAASAPRLVD